MFADFIEQNTIQVQSQENILLNLSLLVANFVVYS